MIARQRQFSPAKQATMLRERIEEVERLAPTTTTPTQTQQKGLQPGIRIHNPQNLDLDTFTKELQIQNGFSPSVSRTAITYAKPVLEKIGFRKKVKIAFSSLWRGEGFQWPDSTVVAGMDIRTEKIEDIMKDPTTAFADALATIEERAKLVDEKLPKNKGALQKQFKQLLKTNPDAALKYILALKAATSQQDIAALMQDLKEKSLAPSPRFPGVKVDNKRMEHYNAPKIGQKIERSWFGMRVKSIQYTTQIEEPSPLASADQKQDTSFLHRQGMDPSTHPTRHQSRARSRTRDPQAIEQDDGHDH